MGLRHSRTHKHYNAFQLRLKVPPHAHYTTSVSPCPSLQWPSAPKIKSSSLSLCVSSVPFLMPIRVCLALCLCPPLSPHTPYPVTCLRIRVGLRKTPFNVRHPPTVPPYGDGLILLIRGDYGPIKRCRLLRYQRRLRFYYQSID